MAWEEAGGKRKEPETWLLHSFLRYLRMSGEWQDEREMASEG